MKRKIDIEKLVRWAYRDELPKAPAAGSFLRPDGFRSPGANLVRTGDLGTSIQEPDIRNRYGMVPDFTAERGPHPDAVTVWQAVQGLDSLDFDLPEDWNPLSDMGDLGALGLAAVARGLRLMMIEVNGKRVLRRSPSELIRAAAILSPPDWKAPAPKQKAVPSSNGRPRYFIRETIQTETGPVEIEVDGFDAKRRLPKPGAYQKHYLDPDPADVVRDRGEYQIWVTALSVLADELAGRLDEHEPTPPERTGWPWEEVGRAAPRMLVDLRPQPVVGKPIRPLAGPLLKRGIEKNDAAVTGPIRKMVGAH